MSQDIPQRIAQLHALYVELTGQDVRLDSSRENAWFLWIKMGFSEDDLKVMVYHLRKGIQAGTRQLAALKFRNLIGQPDYFEEDLAEAKARMRVPKIDQARASVLGASGRPGAEHDGKERMAAAVPPAARPVSEVIEKQFQEFKKLKEEL